ncbi:MAG: response regulator transcription factor [Acidobacteria bacterium]|nr:response regulator transcription factor [Acidobacteriota bacterium]
MRILIVEDDSKMAELLQRGLAAEGHTVDAAADGIAGYEKAMGQAFDAIVLDVMLPGSDGFALTRRLRAQGNKVPILMVTGRDATSDVVRGLDLGADDYLTKPFSFEVLSARLRVITRRLSTEKNAVVQVGDLTVDRETHEVRRAGKPISLTRTEYVILDRLVARPGIVVSRDALVEVAWGSDRDVENNTLDVFIWQLRSKIEAGRASRLIQTVRGFGYAIREGDPE